VITISDVQEALKEQDLDFPDEVVGQVLAAEHGHQRSVLDIPSPRPAEVDEALTARVVHNLHTTGGEPLRRIGYQGDGVASLEAPYRVRAITTEPAEEPAPTTTAKKAAKRPATSAAPTLKEK
jgi:hypothetical protein